MQEEMMIFLQTFECNEPAYHLKIILSVFLFHLLMSFPFE